jgi:hypothetical protein
VHRTQARKQILRLVTTTQAGVDAGWRVVATRCGKKKRRSPLTIIALVRSVPCVSTCDRLSLPWFQISYNRHCKNRSLDVDSLSLRHLQQHTPPNMGVKGLQTFLKENRQSLCTSVHFPTRSSSSSSVHEPRTALVVDAWRCVTRHTLLSVEEPDSHQPHISAIPRLFTVGIGRRVPAVLPHRPSSDRCLA